MLVLGQGKPELGLERELEEPPADVGSVGGCAYPAVPPLHAACTRLSKVTEPL